MSGFRKFILRGNLVDLAVAVVIGTQFSNLVKSFVNSFITPLLNLIGGNPRQVQNLNKLTLTVHRTKFPYGLFLTDAISFLISAAVVYFLIVLPVARLLKLFERDQAATERPCPECTMNIPVAARRCPECTAAITPATDQPQPVG